MDNFGTGIGHSLAALMEDWDEELIEPVPLKTAPASVVFDSGLDNTPPASHQSNTEYQPSQGKFFDMEEDMSTVFQTRVTPPPPKPPRRSKQRPILDDIDDGWKEDESESRSISIRIEPSDILPAICDSASSTIISCSSAEPKSTESGSFPVSDSNTTFSNFILPEPLVESSDSDILARLDGISSKSSVSIYDNIPAQLIQPIKTDTTPAMKRRFDVWLPQIPTKLAGCVEAESLRNEFGQNVNELETYEVDTITAELRRGHKREKSTTSSVFHTLKSKSVSIANLSVLKRDKKKNKKSVGGLFRKIKNSKTTPTLPKTCCVLEAPFNPVFEYITVV